MTVSLIMGVTLRTVTPITLVFNCSPSVLSLPHTPSSDSHETLFFQHGEKKAQMSHTRVYNWSADFSHIIFAITN